MYYTDFDKFVTDYMFENDIYLFDKNKIPQEMYVTLREWYESELGLKDRPKKPDVINTVSINSPYLIDLNEYKERWTNYENNHVNALASFSIDQRIEDFMFVRYGYLKKYCYYYDDRLFDTPIDLEIYIWCVDHDIEIEFKPNLDSDYRIGDKFYRIVFKHLDDVCEADKKPGIIYIHEDDPFIEEISLWMYDHYSDDFLKLFKIGVPFPWPNQDFRDISPSGLIRHFHKSIYTAHYRGQKSAVEVWDDKNLFKHLAINRLKFVGECTPIRMLHGLNIAKYAIKVSTFKNTTAERLITEYLPDAKNIIDPFSGFSGRMLGAMKIGIPYIGFDVSEEHVKESNEILDFIRSNPKIAKTYKSLNASINTANAITNFGVFDCLLTCPPYANFNNGKLSNIEEWNNPNQEVLSCDQWIDICLTNYKCRKYLFVVDDTIVKYLPYVVGTISNKGHIARNVEYIVFIDLSNQQNDEYTQTNFGGYSPLDLDKVDEDGYMKSDSLGSSPFDL